MLIGYKYLRGDRISIVADLILHRDEALSSIISVETFDLALSVGQMHIEEEFGGTDMFSMFSKRISSQISQLIVREIQRD